MPNSNALYLLTETGRKAWWSSTSGLPVQYRRILDLIHTSASVAEIAAELQEYSAMQVADWVDELETLGFISTSSEEPEKQHADERASTVELDVVLARTARYVVELQELIDKSKKLLDQPGDAFQTAA